MVSKLICLIIGHSFVTNVYLNKYGIIDNVCKRCGCSETEGENYD